MCGGRYKTQNGMKNNTRDVMVWMTNDKNGDRLWEFRFTGKSSCRRWDITRKYRLEMGLGMWKVKWTEGVEGKAEEKV